MTSNSSEKTRSGLELWELAYSVFLRILALLFIVFSVQAWMLAIGMSGDGDIRFDTMNTQWRLAIAALCVLHPVTALGLWGLFSWGVAVWLIDILVQLSMHLIFYQLFGINQLLVVFHIVSFAIFVIFQLSLRLTNNNS